MPDFEVFGTFHDGPLLPRGAATRLFLDGSFWSLAENGSLATSALPEQLAGSTFRSAYRSASGSSSVLVQKGGSWFVATYDGTTLGAAVPLPPSASTMEGHAAADGHHWVRLGSTFYEQTGDGFVNRGGGPAAGVAWDVLADGTVMLVAFQSGSNLDPVVVWSLAPGAAAWTQLASLPLATVTTFALPDGFDPASATIAPDGSVHVLTTARCIGEGQRNRAQAYVRWAAGAWQLEQLPSADALTGDLRTWNTPALWAGDAEHVRFVVTSSPAPVFDDFNWVYPDRNLDVVSRCRTDAGALSFERIARAKHPGWTQKGYAAFSESGVATLLTKSLGLTQTW